MRPVAERTLITIKITLLLIVTMQFTGHGQQIKCGFDKIKNNRLSNSDLKNTVINNLVFDQNKKSKSLFKF